MKDNKTIIILCIILIISIISNMYFINYWHSNEYPNGRWEHSQLVYIQNRDCCGSPCTNLLRDISGNKLYFEFYEKLLTPEMFKPYWDTGFNCYMMPRYTIYYHTIDMPNGICCGTHKSIIIDSVEYSGSYAPFGNVTYIGGYVCNEEIYINGEFIRYDNCS